MPRFGTEATLWLAPFWSGTRFDIQARDFRHQPQTIFISGDGHTGETAVFPVLKSFLDTLLVTDQSPLVDELVRDCCSSFFLSFRQEKFLYSLGSVTEIVREAFGGGGSGKRAPASSASTASRSAPRTRTTTQPRVIAPKQERDPEPMDVYSWPPPSPWDP